MYPRAYVCRVFTVHSYEGCKKFSMDNRVHWELAITLKYMMDFQQTHDKIANLKTDLKVRLISDTEVKPVVQVLMPVDTYLKKYIKIHKKKYILS